ncbi:MAG: penicillin-binding protein 2 [Pseudomonadota bacterium]
MRSNGRDDRRKEVLTRRAAILSGGTLLLFGGLGARMYQLQVRDSEIYQMQAEENRINRQIVLPLRGRIVDRFGVEVAGNRPNFQAILVPEQAKDVEDVLSRLADIFPLPDAERQALLRKIRGQKRFIPVTVAENLTWEQFSKLNLGLPYLAGVSPEVGMTRHYVHGAAVSHVIGYVGEPTKAQADAGDDALLRQPGFRVGKAGIEKTVDGKLRGTQGVRFVEVNAYGRVIDELKVVEGTPGAEAVLTIDADIQQFAANRVANDSAAVVVMDIFSGDIIAMVSAPGFDPNDFNRGISFASWRALNASEKKPLLNKIINGLYPPGSTFKAIVALAGLKAGIVNPKTKVHCNGSYRLGRNEWHCWKKGGHGPMDLRDAIKQSCNVYFYDLGRRLGVEAIADMARQFGFDTPTGIEIPGEKGGVVPDPGWKRATLGEPWYPGETLNIAIGQGFLQVSPVQMAVMAARLANGGLAVEPRLLRAVGAELSQRQPPKQMDIDPEHLALVSDGMYAVTNEWGGTARRSRIEVPDMEMSGKTGTVQVRRITREERLAGVIKNEDLPWKRRDHGWFFGYGPSHQPRYAIAVLVEHGGGGSKAAAPVARDILKRVMEKDPSRLPAYGPVAVSQSPSVVLPATGEERL